MADISPQGAPSDRYVVQEYLAEGGMGAIYIGRKLGAGGFSKPVVLKQLLPEFTSQREFRDLFLREARLSATLDHANIVHTIDLVNADEDFFIVMEYVPGADLRTLLKKCKRRGARFSPPAAIYVTRELLSALQYAHNKRGQDGKPLGLIHRDISPSNVLVSHNGEVKLTDFGIAKASTHTSVTYRVKGKLGYMSPEQANNQDLDHRSDLYSLAVCLYEMIAGQRLFVKAGLATSAEEMYAQPVPLLSHTIEGVPPEFDKVMLKALHIDPDHRYQTAGAFQHALQRCAHRAGLLLSTPELAQHLRDVCGAPEQWRNLDEEVEPQGGEFARPGTEVYESTDGSDFLASRASAIDGLGFSEAHDPFSQVDEPEPASRQSRHSRMELDRLRGMELTSMIDISKQRGERGQKRMPSGARPLVDIAELGRAEPAPDNGLPSLGAGLDRTGNSGVQPLESTLEPGPQPYASSSGQMPWHPAPGSSNAGHSTPMPPGGPLGGASLASAFAQPGAHPTISPPAPTVRKRSRVGLWLLLLVLLVLGLAAAAAIGMSGPEMGGDKGQSDSDEQVDPDAENAGNPATDSPEKPPAPDAKDGS